MTFSLCFVDLVDEKLAQGLRVAVALELLHALSEECHEGFFFSALEVGNRLGVTPQAVSKWEQSKTAPDLSLLPKIASLFDCQIDDLFTSQEKNIDF